MEKIKVKEPLRSLEIEPSQVANLVDEAVELQALAGTVGARVESIKGALRLHASTNKLPKNKKGDCILEGTKGKVVISDMSEALDIPAKALWSYLKELNQKNVFWSLVKVRLTEFVNAFGREDAEYLAGGPGEPKLYHKVSIKGNK